MKGWHALMRLAHLINILTLHTVALWETVQTLGRRGTLRFLWQTFTGNWLDLSRKVYKYLKDWDLLGLRLWVSSQRSIRSLS